MVVTAPVAGFKAMPAGNAGLLASMLTSEFAAIAGTPLTLSLLRMFAKGVDAVPATAVPLSVTGVITGETTTVAVVFEQVAVGVVAGIVQMVYGML